MYVFFAKCLLLRYDVCRGSIPVEYIFWQNTYYDVCRGSIPVECFFVPIFSRRLFSIFVGMCGVRFPSSVCIFCKSRVNYVLFDLRRSLHVEKDTGSATFQAKYNSEFRSARTKYHYSSSGNTFFPF